MNAHARDRVIAGQRMAADHPRRPHRGTLAPAAVVMARHGFACLLWALDLEGMSARDKLVLITLARFADGDGRNAFPSQATLSAKTGLGVSSVYRALKSLCRAGWLTEQAKPGSSTVWHIVRPTPGRGQPDRPAPVTVTGESVTVTPPSGHGDRRPTHDLLTTCPLTSESQDACVREREPEGAAQDDALVEPGDSLPALPALPAATAMVEMPSEDDARRTWRARVEAAGQAAEADEHTPAVMRLVEAWSAATDRLPPQVSPADRAKFAHYLGAWTESEITDAMALAVAKHGRRARVEAAGSLLRDARRAQESRAKAGPQPLTTAPNAYAVRSDPEGWRRKVAMMREAEAASRAGGNHG